MNKAKEIIREEFDERLAVMALTYTYGQLGGQRAASLTDEDINSLEGNGLMTENFVRQLARCARRLGSECDFANDIIPYIVTECAFMVPKGDDDYDD